MKCTSIISIFAILFFPIIVARTHTKCCVPGQQIVEKNLTFFCETNSNKRVQANFLDNDLVGRNTSDTCIEIYKGNKTALFNINEENRISKLADVDVNFFPKCCHLQHNYNTLLHSCIKTEEPTIFETLLTKDSFIAIGLQNCKIISDIIVNSVEDLNWSSEYINFTKKNETIPKGQYCLDSTTDSKFVVRKCEEDFQICGQVRCVHKCCADGESFVNGSKCKDTFRYGIDLNATSHIEYPSAPFAIIHGSQKPLHILAENKRFNIDRAGLFTVHVKTTDSFSYYHPTEDSYCMEHAYKKGKVNGYTLFARYVKPILETKFAVTRWVKILSCIFLLLTIWFYLILPKMMNLFGKILLSYCVATFMFFFLLSLSQFMYLELSDGACRVLGLLLVLATLWSFSWLNVMCLDIWFSFGSPRILFSPLQTNKIKRFIHYSYYGWGFPIVWVLIILGFNITHALPDALHPFVGIKQCYLENYRNRPGNYAYHIFLALPVLIQQVMNVILFVRTIIYCLKIKSEIARMDECSEKTNYDAGKEKLDLILKLSVVMGVSFVFEVVSSFYNFSEHKITKNIEVIWDTINCLQGVFIFIIFICKKKILYLIFGKG